ncbi:MAG: hypothetical protein M1830_005860 [Pleopsidium flavum]|nr:MAG: hypothetical protein M1830_005860 [Pleopsidium flavum]
MQSTVSATPSGSNIVLHLHPTGEARMSNIPPPAIPIEHPSDLASIASQMGAIHKLDLTSDVTHLLVGDSDTPKYKYVAKLRPDVKSLRPEWVDAVRKSWIEGGATDVEALEAQYTLPVFVGLRICVTGFEELDYRQQVLDLININGGDYRGDLTKDVTHLVAKTAEGKKYAYAGAWGIKIVSTEWLRDSLERGMILDESLYHPTTPVQERGRNAWVRRTVSTTSLGKRMRDDEPALNTSRKLRRTASAKLGSQNEGIWTDIVGGGFGPHERKKSEWDERRRKADVANDRPSRANTSGDSIAGDAAPPEFGPHNGDVECNAPTVQITHEAGVRRGLFQGKRFFVHGFDERRTSILQNHLSSHNAEITSSFLELSQHGTPNGLLETYLIVPHTSSQSDIPSTPDSSTQPTTVTDMWVERCLHSKIFVQPRDNVTSATYEEYFTSNASVLICNSTSPSIEKLRHALQWNVPAVSADWLWDCVKRGIKTPFHPYLINHPREFTDVSRPKTLSKRLEGRTDKGYEAGPPLTDEVGMDSRHPKHTKKQQAKKRTQSSSGSVDVNPRNRSAEPQPPTSGTPLVPDDEDHLLGPANDSHDNNHGVSSEPAPLQEISPNSPTKPSSIPSHTKDTSSLPPNPTDLNPSPDPPEQDSLSTSIAALLAHNKQLRSLPTLSDPLSRPQPPSAPVHGRRKRQLLGRAPSNVSARSNSISISRASSVDTLNTDGLGTPIESATISFAALDSVGARSLHEEQRLEDEEVEPRGTQLGYDDPEVGEWRERMVRKMVGKGKGEGTPGKRPGERVRSIGTVRDVAGRGAGGERVTRQKGLRRQGF